MTLSSDEYAKGGRTYIGDGTKILWKYVYQEYL